MFTYLPNLAEGIENTLVVTFGAFLIGSLLAIPLTALRMCPVPPLRWIAASYIDLLRAIPPLTWIFLLYFGIATGSLQLEPVPAATISLGLIASAYLAEIYRAGVQGVARGQWEAATAIGLSPVTTIRRVIIPQATVIVTPPASTYLIGLLKESALASTIGAQEITFHAFTESQKTFHSIQIFSLAALLYIALSIPLAVLSRWLSGRITRRLERA